MCFQKERKVVLIKKHKKTKRERKCGNFSVDPQSDRPEYPPRFADAVVVVFWLFIPSVVCVRARETE